MSVEIQIKVSLGAAAVKYFLFDAGTGLRRSAKIDDIQSPLHRQRFACSTR